MKYQDLCIALQQIAQNYGVNSVFFEDINLLNSEDVIYPALVCQLKNVELQDGYDRYTLILTLANRVTEITTHANTMEIKTTPNNILYCTALSITNGGFTSTGGSFFTYTSLSFLNGEICVENVSDLSFTLRVHSYEQPVFIWANNNGWLGYDNYNVNPHERKIINCHNSLLQVWERRAVTIGNISLRVITQSKIIISPTTITYDTIRAIRSALDSMNGVRVESCNVQPFKYKFRDECEGITAEINLSLFFDSRCN